MGPLRTHKCIGYQQITTLSSATALTIPSDPQTNTKATSCLLQSETQNVRWRDDGTNPTATVGMLILTSAPNATYYDGDLTKIRFIEATASAKLNVSYYVDELSL